VTASTADRDLVDLARAVIRERYRPGWHVVGAALRTRSGRVFTGVHLEATVGRIAVCAEAIALGRAATEAGDTDVEMIVAVKHPERAAADQEVLVVPPCGMCREMIADYAPTARVIVPDDRTEIAVVPIAELLPRRYRSA
jgi:cytidine deaminase